MQAAATQGAEDGDFHPAEDAPMLPVPALAAPLTLQVWGAACQLVQLSSRLPHRHQLLVYSVHTVCIGQYDSRIWGVALQDVLRLAPSDPLCGDGLGSSALAEAAVALAALEPILPVAAPASEGAHFPSSCCAATMSESNDN